MLSLRFNNANYQHKSTHRRGEKGCAILWTSACSTALLSAVTLHFSTQRCLRLNVLHVCLGSRDVFFNWLKIWIRFKMHLDVGACVADVTGDNPKQRSCMNDLVMNFYKLWVVYLFGSVFKGFTCRCLQELPVVTCDIAWWVLHWDPI